MALLANSMIMAPISQLKSMRTAVVLAKELAAAERMAAAAAEAAAEARAMGGAVGGDFKKGVDPVYGPAQKKAGGFWARMWQHTKTFFGRVGKAITGAAKWLGPALLVGLRLASGWLTGTLWPWLVGAGQAIAGFFAGIPLALAGAAAAAVGSMAFLAYTIWKNWDELGRAFTYLWDQMVAKAKALGGAIVDAFKSGLAAAGRFLMTGSFSESSGERGLGPEALTPPKLSPQVASAVSNTQHIKAEFNVSVDAGQGADGKKIGEAAASSLGDKVRDMFEDARLAMGA